MTIYSQCPALPVPESQQSKSGLFLIRVGLYYLLIGKGRSDLGEDFSGILKIQIKKSDKACIFS
jgi:hypothetical protein